MPATTAMATRSAQVVSLLTLVNHYVTQSAPATRFVRPVVKPMSATVFVSLRVVPMKSVRKTATTLAVFVPKAATCNAMETVWL